MTTPNTSPIVVSAQVQSEASDHELILSQRFVGKLTKGSTTPSVKNVEKWQAVNTGAVSITDFKDGQEGQTLFILGDGQTTLVNGTSIKTNTSANLLLAVNLVYILVRFNNIWIQAKP